jgi:2-keto-4-pentenoate hydratase/2-oxohepta-3-ene-1,7-dioic acid hydratase in catechol pathway
MKLLTFSTDSYSTRRLGAYLGERRVLDLPRAYTLSFGGQAPDWFASVADLLMGGEPALSLARQVVERANADSGVAALHDVDRIAFHPPTAHVPKVLCVTMNYLSHAQASLSKPSEEPYFFIKFPNVLTPHRAPVLCSRTSQKCDSEIELAVIIGRRGKYITRERAMDHVAGYTVANDFSFRDRRALKSDPDSARLHWLTLKNLDTAAPIGPWLVTKDEIPDPYKLEITLTLDNDPAERQTGNTSGMMHTIADLIHHASDGLTLEPGDVILTGTPHEVAFGHQRFLTKGDILRAEIEKIGALVNPVEVER